MSKRRLYILISFTILAVVLLAGCSSTYETEEDQPWHDLPFYVPATEWTVSFEEVSELFELKQVFDSGDNRALLDFLEGSNVPTHSIIQEQEVYDFFQVIERTYLPVGKGDWLYASYSYDVMLSMTYTEDFEFVYMISITTNERFSRNSLDYSIETALEITDFLLPFRQDERQSESSLRVGEDIFVFQTAAFDPSDPSAPARFFLDVQGTYVAIFFHGTPSEEYIFQILANLEFVRGLDAWQIE